MQFGISANIESALERPAGLFSELFAGLHIIIHQFFKGSLCLRRANHFGGDKIVYMQNLND